MVKTKEEIKKRNNIYFKEYYKNNPEKYKLHLEVCKKWYNKNKEKVKKTYQVWIKKNPEKIKIKCLKERTNRKVEVKARQMAYQKLNKEEKGEICKDTQNLENHHWRYDKPLLVNTLCKTCHKIQHIKNFDRWNNSQTDSDKLLEVAN